MRLGFQAGRLQQEGVVDFFGFDVVPVAVIVFGRAKVVPRQLVLVFPGELLGEVGGPCVDGGSVVGMDVYRDSNDVSRHCFWPPWVGRYDPYPK